MKISRKYSFYDFINNSYKFVRFKARNIYLFLLVANINIHRFSDIFRRKKLNTTAKTTNNSNNNANTTILNKILNPPECS